MKRIFALFLTLSLTVGLFTACSGGTPSESSAASTTSSAVSSALSSLESSAVSESSEVSVTPVSRKDDFFHALNGEWIAKTEIPADKFIVGVGIDLQDKIDKTLREDLDKMLKGEIPVEDKAMENTLVYYKNAMDFDAREKAGATPLLADIAQIEALKTLAEFNAQLADWILAGKTSPFVISIFADMGDAEHKGIYIGAPKLFLPDKTYYEEGNANGVMLMGVYKDMLKKLLLLAGKAEVEADKIVAEAVAFDQSMVPYIKSTEESVDYAKMYNPAPIQQFNDEVATVDFARALESILGVKPEMVINTDPKYFAAFKDLVNEDTFANMKSWMTVKLLLESTDQLSEAFYEAAGAYTKLLSGATELPPKEENAYAQVFEGFGEPIGVYYGKTYFGEEAKKDVEQMIHNMTRTFVKRINENTWLSADTKAKAIKKVETIAVNVGYPEKIHPIFEELQIISKEDGGSFYDNAKEVNRISIKRMFDEFDKPVDRNQWIISAATVNAMYSPTDNSINFPAAILQAPFYSLDQTPSKNYGGIGAVIAHEITHAFDPQGAKFDEFGNLKDWWTEADRQKFDELSQKMVAQFEGIDFAGGKVNGKLTAAENIADAGGIRCALEVVKEMPDGNLAEFFDNWAIIWRAKMTDQIVQLLLTTDSHAPNELRVNTMLPNFDEFHETYDIKEGDKMYRAPEDRVLIW